MIDTLFSALSGLRTSSARLQTSANNVANLQTPGFKASRPVIVEVKSGGARVSGTVRNSLGGAVLQTGNPFDVAVGGAGFFQVNFPGGGSAFTRSGNFRLDSTGRLVDPGGNPVQPEITVPGNATGFAVGADGQVSGQVNGTTQTLGQLQLANFNNPGGLTSLGSNLFAASAASGQAVLGAPGTDGLGVLIPGALETSNVDLTQEAVDQILAKNAFRANANVIRTADEMTGVLLDIRT